MRFRPFATCAIASLCVAPAHAAVVGLVQGIVHDQQHRPIASARVELHATHSAFTRTTTTAPDGSFAFPAIPIGSYRLDVQQPGFASQSQPLTLVSGTTPVLHFELAIASDAQSVTVETQPTTAASVTPTTLLNRDDIALTPAADQVNSLAMITDFVPGAYMTHDMLHMRGGHQVSWAIDGVQVPNTNIASNLAAQIAPRDIDVLEIQRGSYAADTGDRTYGVFNILPRTGFERDRQAELILTAGSYLQTDDQLSFGDHTPRRAYYVSLAGNRSDFGLAPPTATTVHDRTNGQGAFVSLISNHTPADQLRLVAQAREDFFQIPYDPDPNSFGNQQFDSSGLRDTQTETDALAIFSWLHSFSPATLLNLSPYVHFNRADYDPGPADEPEATTSHRASTYLGAQAAITSTLHTHSLQAGIYGFAQRDTATLGTSSFRVADHTPGGLVEAYASDSFHPTSWLTVIAGLRQSWFTGQITENATAPRIGLAVQIPRLHWTARAFYGRFYQPPPLLTATGPLLAFAQSNNTTFTPLHGERDEEHQFGLQIPYRGFVLDLDTFRTRARNFLDHSNIGDSSIYYPVTLDGALIRAWELSLKTPRLFRVGTAHLSYSNQIAESRGTLTGGLVCYPVASAQCSADFTYQPVDHDQRNTLSAGVTAQLPRRVTASANVTYGSGFVNGNPDPATPYPNPYLPAHTAVDVSLGKQWREALTTSLTVTNLSGRRTLLDNSLTFGGFHYNSPRLLYAELRYHFHY